jgi:hypothetical protein
LLRAGLNGVVAHLKRGVLRFHAVPVHHPDGRGRLAERHVESLSPPALLGTLHRDPWLGFLEFRKESPEGGF